MRLNKFYTNNARDSFSIKKKLKSLGIKPKKTLGQNFLVGKEVIQKILSQVEKASKKEILEIGPGLGALTEALTKKKKSLTLIEKDKNLSNYWRQRNFVVIEDDALRINWNLFPSHLIIGNLPYSIASRLLIEISLKEKRENQMLLMFQKEVGQRITSSPFKKSYGLLSVIAQVFWNIEYITEAPPEAFYPQPKVSGWVLFFDRKKIKIKNTELFLKFVKRAFSHRRKYMINNLRSFFLSLNKDFDEEVFFQQFNLHKKIRAEEVSPPLFLKIFNDISIFLTTK